MSFTCRNYDQTRQTVNLKRFFCFGLQSSAELSRPFDRFRSRGTLNRSTARLNHIRFAPVRSPWSRTVPLFVGSSDIAVLSSRTSGSSRRKTSAVAVPRYDDKRTTGPIVRRQRSLTMTEQVPQISATIRPNALSAKFLQHSEVADSNCKLLESGG